MIDDYAQPVDAVVVLNQQLEMLQQLGIPVKETNLGRYEALQADEIFCTATTYGLVHASSFEGQRVGDGKPGPIFQKLLQAWKDLADLDFVVQAQTYSRQVAEWEEQQRPVLDFLEESEPEP